MINDKKVLALIPARGGSKGLPGKNILPLHDKPLIGWPIQAARKSLYVDKVVVSTDSQEICQIALKQGAEVPFLRPAELATDTASSMMVVEHAIRFWENQGEPFDYLVLLEPTSPLTEAEDIDKALEMLDAKRKIADSIVGVSKVEATHPTFNITVNKNGVLEPYFTKELSSGIMRQDIQDLYFFEGSLYISDISVFLETLRFNHDRTLGYIVPRWKSFEIDEMVDLICVEAIMNNLQRIKGES